MVNVTKVTPVGAYVTLLEYGNIEVWIFKGVYSHFCSWNEIIFVLQGMILSSELSRRRIRSMNKLIRVGRNEVVMVLRVDEEKGYIDLSKRRVNPEDIVLCEDRFDDFFIIDHIYHTYHVYHVYVDTPKLRLWILWCTGVVRGFRYQWRGF